MAKQSDESGTARYNEHPRLAALHAKHEAMLKASLKAKPNAFKRVTGQKGIKLGEGESLQGVYMGYSVDGKFTNHTFACMEKGQVVEKILSGTTVINQALSELEPGTSIVRVTREGSKISKGGRTVFLYDVGVLE